MIADVRCIGRESCQAAILPLGGASLARETSGSPHRIAPPPHLRMSCGGVTAVPDLDDEWAKRFADSIVVKLLQQRDKAIEDVRRIESDVASILASDSPSRADLHALLDACLDLQPLSQRTVFTAEEAARRIGQSLLEGALRWTERLDRPNLALNWAALESDLPARRQELWYRLSRAPHLLPPALMQELLTALLHLNDGTETIPPFFTPEPKVGRGRSPKEARECEEFLWEWISWRAGCGQRISDAVSDVSAAVGRSAKAVEAWRSEWIARAGQEEVSRRLEAAKERGISGQNFLGNLPMESIAMIWKWAREPDKLA